MMKLAVLARTLYFILYTSRLGAIHDSKSGCYDDAGSIMINEVALNTDQLQLKNIWYFSTCTLNQIYSYLAIQTSYLNDNGISATAYDAFKFAPLAGATNSWKEQCVLKFEVGSVKCDPTSQNRTYIDDMCESNIHCTASNETPCGDLDAVICKQPSSKVSETETYKLV